MSPAHLRRKTRGVEGRRGVLAALAAFEGCVVCTGFIFMRDTFAVPKLHNGRLRAAKYVNVNVLCRLNQTCWGDENPYLTHVKHGGVSHALRTQQPELRRIACKVVFHALSKP